MKAKLNFIEGIISATYFYGNHDRFCQHSLMNRTYSFETEIFCNINVFLVTLDKFNAFPSEKRMIVVYFYISARYTKTMIVLIIFY